MLSILQIDGVAKRYGKLPSEVLKEADTFDLYIMDVALSFEKYHHDKAMNKGVRSPESYSSNELLEIYNKGKEQNG